MTRYLGRPELREKAAAHVRQARKLWRDARTVRRSRWPDVARHLEMGARRHMGLARWLADGAPEIAE